MTRPEPIAIVGISAIMPDAPTAQQFWANIQEGRYSISDVPPERWDPELYFDKDPGTADKTYSRIGGWVREFPWDPIRWKLPIPPNVSAHFDPGQMWSVSAARSALVDAGWPNWDVDPDRVGVILGSALGGDKYVRTSLRISYPEFESQLASAPSFAALPVDVQATIRREAREGFLGGLPTITEDTMPGELANILAGRVAALFNFRGPNFTTDAACASALAGISSAIGLLATHQVDAVISGGVDRNMGPGAFVRFCAIGALSATGTRPFDAGADGFVMGEGAALFVLKRLSDAEKAGDKVYAVILGLSGSSDGKGKGITAPNPIGQKLAVGRAWAQAGVDPATVGLLEAHGTSTRVGDATELGSLDEVFAGAGAKPGTIALGSVKSNIGHLKAAAGSAGLFKAVQSLHNKVLPPSLHFQDPNPNVDWARTPFRVNTELRPWEPSNGDPRRAGVSAFGFGGTNFHVVLEEHVPGRYRAEDAPRSFAGATVGVERHAPQTQPSASGHASSAPAAAAPQVAAAPAPAARKTPLRGAAVVGGPSDADVIAQLTALAAAAGDGRAPAVAPPDPKLADAAIRVAIDFSDAADLAKKAGKAVQALQSGNAAMFKLLRSQGVFVGRGPAPKVAFLFTGQGSQYVNMLAGLRDHEPLVRAVYDEADRIMTPLLGKPLSEFVFSADTDKATVDRLNQQLLQTEITQPAVLTTDAAMTELLAAYGVTPDMVMGHSLGEYGALVASGALTFDAALEAVSARGREMKAVSHEDNGAMAAVFGPLPDIERIVGEVDGYVVVANINSNTQAVIGGATVAVEAAVARFNEAGITAMRIPVSHAFHTQIVAGASEPLKVAMRRLEVRGPRLPIVANVSGEFYPEDAGTETMLEILGRQIAEPVQFVKGLHTLYEAGARVFVEVGPKKALHGFVEEVLGSVHADVLALFTNHPKLGDLASFNQALCGLWASGLGYGAPGPSLAGPTLPAPEALLPTAQPTAAPVAPTPAAAAPAPVAPTTAAASPTAAPTASPSPSALTPRTPMTTARYEELGRLFADVLEQGMRVYGGAAPQPAPAAGPAGVGAVSTAPVVITGAALGLPGVDRVFDDANLARILDGQQFIDVLPARFRQAMVDKRITRLVKKAGQDPVFETIDDASGVIKLAGRGAPLNVVEEFGVEAARDAALDRTTRLAIGAGLDALRDAGIPLVMRYRSTTLGTMLPDRWGLPESMRDETGVIFASAFPGYGEFASDIEKYMTDRGRREQLLALEAVRARMTGSEPAAAEVDRRIAELRHLLATDGFTYDRRFIFRCLAMGHSQFAELIGARGPNTQINAACASTTQAASLAQDWISTGRCKRVIVVSADDVSSDVLLPWVASGFLASGAAATEDVVADVATPFDRRRHGMVVGMGAAAFVVESPEAAHERGLQPICELLASVTANSAFHGTRLDVEHVGMVMEDLVRRAEARGIDRYAIAPNTVFVSHETYTPARGGSAAAEINALRRVFGPAADSIVITNTKGFTGHAMGAGVEDVVAIKALETGIVPPVPNYKEPDPDLGALNLSLGGAYPVQYALRLAAGFGSQIAMSLYRWTPMPDGRHRHPSELGYASRIVDPDAWARWLDGAAGRPGAQLEVDRRRLRIVDAGAPAAPPAPAAPLAAPVRAATPATVTPTRAPSVAVPAAPAPVVAPTSAPVVAASAPAPAPAEPAVDPVTEAVVGIVSQMTGYPPELLDVDLDLEADLGVDTVKQAEVFAAVRERFGVERDDTVALRDFPTLTHVIGWVREKADIPAAPVAVTPAAAAVAPAAPPEPAAPAADEVTDAVVGIVAEMTGYPPELLDVDLDLEADLGVDTVKQAEVFAAVRERFGVERDDAVALRDFPTLTHVIGWIREKTGIQPTPAGPDPSLERIEQIAETVVAESPVAAAPAADEVVDAVVGIVAEMTGYPAELLDLDLDLEADLGVDTVKQAEVFAAVRERFGVERDDTVALRDFPTLTHVIGWVRDKTGIQPVAATAPAPAAPVAAPAPSAPVAAPVAAPESAAPAGDEVVDAVVAIVAEMTGYPSELLDLDLDLEADLGVDTVKQAEVFAAVRGRFDLERDDTVQLRDFPTLTHVIGWVRDKTGIQPVAATAPAPAAPVAAPAPSAAAPAPVAESAAPAADEVVDAVVAIVAEMTGYPSELLDLDLDLEADLGVDTVKQAEVFAAVRGRFDLERDDTVQLRDFPTLTHVIGWVRDKTGIQPVAAAAPAPAAPVAAPAPSAAAPAPVAESAAPAADEVVDAVVLIVAEMTGYPSELLDLDLDLEADLGVDTVKQAEVFAAVRGRFDLERDDTVQLRDFPTLTHVIGWVRDKTGIQPAGAGATGDGTEQPSAATAPAASAPATAVAAAPAFVGDFDAVDALPRRIPVPALRPAITACLPTDVELGPDSRVLVVLDDGGVGAALVKRLEKRGASVLAVEASTGTDDLLSAVAGFTAEAPLTGVYWLASLDDEGDVADLDLAGWREALRRRVVALHALFHEVSESAPFLVTGSRLGGFLGHDADGATSPLGAAVVGFAKAYKREAPAALVKAVDFPASRKTSALADVLIEETLSDPGCVEIGRVEGDRWGVGLLEAPFPAQDAPAEGAMELSADSVFLVTGAAGSIVSAITADLASHSGGTFHLLDLAPHPDRDDPDLRAYLEDPQALKPRIAEQIAARGEKPTPVRIERELARFERLASALTAIDAVQAAGGTAHYHCVDLRDGDAVGAVMDRVREVSGKVDVLLHAAGLEISKPLAKKDRPEFELVFGVKSDGWFNLMKSAGDLPIGATVAFSSVAGRFGNAGQTDYAAANNLLCAIASNMRRTRPQTRGLALDWTAWGGIGMATRGSIPKIMAAAGVQMLPPEAGIAWIRRELTSGAPAGEVVVAGRLGMMAAEHDPTGGVDPKAFADACENAGPMVGEVVAASVNDGLVVRTTLDPASQPFLDDHRIDGTAVLPGVMGMEAFAEAAQLMAPDWNVVAVEDVDFLAPLKFYRDEPRSVQITALLRPAGEELVAECSLWAERQLVGHDEVTRTTHFTGRVRLSRSVPEPQDAPVPQRGGAEVSADEVYRLYFHGPAYQVVTSAWRAGDAAAAQFATDLPANHVPAEPGTVLTPRLAELCFQTAGLLEAGREGRLALPAHVGTMTVFPAAGERVDGLVGAAWPTDGGFDCVVTDGAGAVLLRMAGYRTVALPQPLDDDVRAPLKAALDS